MISQGAVSLRAARADCGYSQAGGLKGVQAFKDRTLSSNPSLGSLRGTVLAMSIPNAPTRAEGKQSDTNWSRETFVSHTPNYNGFCSQTLYGYLKNMGSYLQAKCKSEQQLATGDALLGWSFIGRGSGKIRFRVSASTGTNGTEFIEFIAWPDNYFSGTPIYLYTSSASNQNPDTVVDIPSTHTYLTLNVQNFSRQGSNYTTTNITQARAYRA